jgi:hypothetical protein
VYAVTRHLPPETRDDVALELRATIEDTIDGQSDRVPREVAEREALAALGDPERLADAYRGGPRYLIGPVVYPHYLRLLKLLLIIVAPIAGGLAGLGLALEGDVTAGEVITGVVGAMVTAALQVAFWCTLGFVIAERTGAIDEWANRPWDPDTLESEPPPRQIGWGEGVFELRLLLVLLVLLAFGPNPLVTASDGSKIPLFGPVPTGLRVALVVVLAASIVLAVRNLVRGRWSYPAAVANLVLNLAFVIGALWLLLGGNLISESSRAALAGVVPLNGLDVALRVAAGLVVVIVVWDSVEGFVKAHQAATAPRYAVTSSL